MCIVSLAICVGLILGQTFAEGGSSWRGGGGGASPPFVIPTSTYHMIGEGGGAELNMSCALMVCFELVCLLGGCDYRCVEHRVVSFRALQAAYLM